MKRIILILLIALCALSCAKTEPLGPGVSVDKHGNLKINAPLYVIDRNYEKPGLKKADTSLNIAVSVHFHVGDDIGSQLEVTGGIVNGRLSITIQKPEDDQLFYSAANFLSVSDDLFKTGSDAAITELFMYPEVPGECINSLILCSNPVVELLDSYEFDVFDVDGYKHYYFYSLEDVIISGRDQKYSRYSDYTWYNDFDISMKQGWNVICMAEIYDEMLNRDVTTMTSSTPPPDAVWILRER